MTSARLIAIDEPSLGLAPNIIDQVYDRLIALLAQRALTLLIVAQSSTRAMLFGLTAFLKRTRYGLEMRAAAENFTMARMLWVRANRVIMAAFALSGALAAAIGLILVAQTATADIQMGRAVMLMGLYRHGDRWPESLPGAVLGVVMILILVFRPAGIMGNRELCWPLAKHERPGHDGGPAATARRPRTNQPAYQPANRRKTMTRPSIWTIALSTTAGGLRGRQIEVVTAGINAMILNGSGVDGSYWLSAAPDLTNF